MTPTEKNFIYGILAGGTATGIIAALVASLWCRPCPQPKPIVYPPWITETPGIPTDTTGRAPPVVVGWLND